jgi:ABC-type glycerol-3-phosphate transport system substrate-binding protein
MEQKTSNFQIFILIAFGFFMIVGIMLFATAKLSPNNGSEGVVPVVMWGTPSSEVINKVIDSILEKDKGIINITYVQKDSRNFEQTLVEAIADGVGPDIVILPQDIVLKNLNKFVVLPYASYPLRTFKDQFIDAGSIYLNDEGVVAIPYIVDPLVMYWNKTYFVNAGIVNPPKQWDEFSKVVTKLTKKDSNFNISLSGTAFGEYQNVLHAKDILSMLFLQAGVPIVAKNTIGNYDSSLIGNYGKSESPAEVALTFYTDFANPAKEVYSWNKSLKSSLDSFVSADTAIYFGFASELSGISFKNPNLNFDVAMVPQVLGANKKSVYAKMYGLAVLKTSKNQTSSFNQILTLSSKEGISLLSSIGNLPPVRKDVLASSPQDLYMQIFYNSALISDTWLDPNPNATEVLFKNMIESVIVGKNTASVAISNAENQMGNIISQNVKNLSI